LIIFYYLKKELWKVSTSDLNLFNNLPTIKTSRLILRKFTHEDVSDVYEYGKDPKVAEYVLWYPHSSQYESLEFVNNTVQAYLNGEPSPWAIEFKENGKVIGSTGFFTVDYNHHKGEIGYALSREYWGKGIMPEAVNAVIGIGFNEFGLNRIQAHTSIDNKGSAKVLLKCGMKFEGTMRAFVKVKGEFWDVNYYAILRKEWEKKG